MNSQLLSARMAALAYLYDNMRDLPEWLRRLTPTQVQDLSQVMVLWHIPRENGTVLPMEEIERRELVRALTIFKGNVIEAAKALNISKTTLYRKLKQWGYTVPSSDSFDPRLFHIQLRDSAKKSRHNKTQVRAAR